MYQTAWTKKGSSVPSDRIKPARSQPSAGSKGKSKQPQQVGPPKSKEVRRLESLLRALRESNGTEKDPKGGCFCQAREHLLSNYSPLCNTCGLILCSVNLPHYSCPHCSTPVVTAAVRSSLVTQLESQISETVIKETQEKERAIEEARREAGAFPTLAGPPAKPQISGPSVLNPNSTHKVLSLNAKTKRVTVSSYTPTPVSSRPVSRAEAEVEEVTRVPPPPTGVVHATRRVDYSRPWENLRQASIHYVPLSRVDNADSAKGPGRRKKRNGGKDKTGEKVDVDV